MIYTLNNPVPPVLLLEQKQSVATVVTLTFFKANYPFINLMPVTDLVWFEFDLEWFGLFVRRAFKRNVLDSRDERVLDAMAIDYIYQKKGLYLSLVMIISIFSNH